MYRITNSMLNANYVRNLQTNLGNMSTLQNQLSSGKKISSGADDPRAAAQIMSLNDDISANNQYGNNIQDVTHLLDTEDSALSEANNVLSRMRTLMVKAGNGTYSEDELASIKDEMVSCVSQLGNVLNTSYNGKYVFGGSKTTSGPISVNSTTGAMSYSDDYGNAISTSTSGTTTTTNVTLSNNNQLKSGGITITGITETNTSGTPSYVVSYTDSTGTAYDTSAAPSSNIAGALTSAGITNSTDNTNFASKLNSYLNNVSTNITQIGSDLNTNIADGVSIAYNVNAGNLLETTDSNGNSVDAMSVFSDIINNLSVASDQNAADADQSTARTNLTGSLLTNLDSVIDSFEAARSKIGTLQNRMDSAASVNENQNYSMTYSLSNTEDIDYAEAEVNYSSAQTVYKASLQVSSKVLNTTLLDYL